MQVKDDSTSWNTNSSLYGNIPINDLNEWSLDKLGWYKTSSRRRSKLSRQMRKIARSFHDQNDHDQITAHTFSQIKRSLSVEVQNCAGNMHSYAVHVSYCIIFYHPFS